MLLQEKESALLDLTEEERYVRSSFCSSILSGTNYIGNQKRKMFIIFYHSMSNHHLLILFTHIRASKQYVHVHTYAHTHTCLFTHTFTRTHIRKIHTHKCIHTQIYIHTRTHTHRYTCTSSLTHTNSAPPDDSTAHPSWRGRAHNRRCSEIIKKPTCCFPSTGIRR